MKGAYVVIPEGEGDPELVIVATGSEVHVGSEAVRRLQTEGHRVRLVSLPSLEVFRAQEEAYQEEVLPPEPRRLVVEAGVELGLSPLLRPGDRFHGMIGFGVSAPAKDLAEHFGFTPDRVVEIARSML
jgi:transketolase